MKVGEFAAQGDIIIRRVEDNAALKESYVQPRRYDSIILAEGEKTGHLHEIKEANVKMFREPALNAGDKSLYIGHLKVEETAKVVHPEHDTITLEKGEYVVSRQRQHDPFAARQRIIED